ncbi:MAG TPA: hypothetical protein VK217_10130 [Acidimicrobiales bacterium]|nr:hypothetical protein [Acidimicrobiales bacterium]
MRTEILVAADELMAAGDCWHRSYQAWQKAVGHRDRVIARAELRVVRSTRSAGLRKCEADRRRRRINTRAEASTVARAVRARAEVQSTLEEAYRLRALEDAAVLATRLELAETTKQVLRYGRFGLQLTGMTSAALHGLARRPRAPIPTSG